MISRFFSKSKPVHYVIVGLLLLIIYSGSKLYFTDVEFELSVLAKDFGLYLTLLMSLFVFDFFVSRNSLTKKNSYGIFLYALFFAVLPSTMLNSEIIFANFFVLLAIRRIISIRSQKHIKKKLFDAAFWITIASLFVFWSSIFLVLVFLALLVYNIADIKNYIIPVIGSVTVAILTVSYLFIFQIDLSSYLNDLIVSSFDFSSLNSKRIILGATLLFSLGLWSVFYYIRNIRSQMKSYRPSFTLVLVATFLSLAIIAIAPYKDGSEFIFLFAPLAIIITNYLEVISERWFKEALLWLVILTPIGISLL